MTKSFAAANLTVYSFSRLLQQQSSSNRFADYLTELSVKFNKSVVLQHNTLQIHTVTSSKKLVHFFAAFISKCKPASLIIICIRIKVLNRESCNKNVYQAKRIFNMVIHKYSHVVQNIFL